MNVSVSLCVCVCIYAIVSETLWYVQCDAKSKWETKKNTRTNFVHTINVLSVSISIQFVNVIYFSFSRDCELYNWIYRFVCHCTLEKTYRWQFEWMNKIWECFENCLHSLSLSISYFVICWNVGDFYFYCYFRLSFSFFIPNKYIFIVRVY